MLNKTTLVKAGLSLSYIFFMISNYITLFCDFQFGAKFNCCVSLVSDTLFLMHLWLFKEKKTPFKEK
ncbi:hypothetical protein CWO85_00965 [Candidatus Phytoplasma ziziphi]|uniref:Uncharacterized protein n=1 Tax=Ziziphus jujuba witches'-broom phytoplasma TaxID=135727 RepID=A0A660HM50_ZIZJU|nr:hypothetical protein [Candidatus Phytoplasma ziziphi]AYJ01108.1 hypothetical protein CWO85_00965 [Candidatus Phytoplasma ziziphi]